MEKKPEKKSRLKLHMQFLALLGIICAFGVALYMSGSAALELDSKIDERQAEIDSINKEIEGLEYELLSRETDAYAERYAYETWGFVKDNQIIFKVK